jgi:hypothetical protein
MSFAGCESRKSGKYESARRKDVTLLLQGLQGEIRRKPAHIWNRPAVVIHAHPCTAAGIRTGTSNVDVPDAP